MAVQIQFHRDLAAAWTSANPTLAEGELGLETDTGQFKVGDGSTDWNTLTYGGLTGPQGPPGSALVTLSDVDASTAVAGDGLVYDGDDWVNQSVVVAVEHGSNASVARPSGVVVYWKGSVSPDNAIDGDVWYDTSS